MKAQKSMFATQASSPTVLDQEQMMYLLGGNTTGGTGSGSSSSEEEPYHGSTDEAGPGEID